MRRATSKSSPPVCRVAPEPPLDGSTHRYSGGAGDSTTVNNPRQSSPARLASPQSVRLAAIKPDKVAPVIAGPHGRIFNWLGLPGKAGIHMRYMGECTLSRIVRGLKRGARLAILRFAPRSKCMPAPVADRWSRKKEATPEEGGLSQGGNAHKGLWDQAAACSIGEKGSPRLSAAAS